MAVWLSPFEHLARINAGLYLESGFYDLRSSGKCTADAYKPAILQYDGATASYVTGTTTPLQGAVTLVRKFWEIDTPYNVGARITPYSEGDLTQIWECVVAGTSGSSDPAWDSVTIGNITTDGPDVQWQYDPGFDGGLAEEPFTGESLAAGMLSQSVGCETLALEVTDPCGNNWVSQVGPAYCSGVFPQKDAQYKVPSSTYSGKLALYVQALYGSKRTDYEPYGQELRVGGSDDEHPLRSIPRGFQGSGWVYTTDNFDYFYCVFAAGTLTLYPMDLSEEGRRFKDTLDLHADTSFDFVKRAEAYILSTARINKTAAYTVEVIGPQVLGSPLDYGWHVNWKGDEASVVTFYVDPENPQYLSTQHQLAITELWDGSVYTFTCTNNPITTDAAWWPWTSQLHLFYYDEVEQSMIPVDYPAIIFGGYTGTFDAPIYNYYVLDEASGTDTLVTCDIFMDVIPQTSINFDLDVGHRFSSPQRYLTEESKQYAASGGEKGFRVGGVVTSVNLEEMLRDTKTEHYPVSGPQHRGWPFDRNGPTGSLLYVSGIDWGIANGLAPGETKEIFDPDTGTTRTCWWEWRTKWLYMGYERTANVSAKGTSGSAFFEVLKGDCAGVVAGESETSYADGSSTHEIKETLSGLNGVYKPFDGSIVWFVPSSFYSYKILEYVYPAPPDQAMVFGNEFWGNTTQVLWSEVPAFTDAADTTLNSFPKGVVLQSFNGAVAGNAEYFSPTISDKPTHTVDTGRRSIGNLYKVDHADFNEDGGYLNDSSVGWA